MTITINIIGAGNAGKTIGHLLAKNTSVTLAAVWTRSEQTALAAIQFMGSGFCCIDLSSLPPADITLITTPDDHITRTCEAIRSRLKPGSIVAHCSGSLTSDALISAHSACFTASVHPMHSFARSEVSVKNYAGTYCSLEGHPKALAVLDPLFKSIGSQIFTLKKDKKTLYHAAGVFASNYLITLAQQSLNFLEEAGIENQTAMRIITGLMHNSVTNLEDNLSPALALTGPIKRGDVSTIRDHLNAFSSVQQKDLYKLLGKATLDICSLSEECNEQIVELFAT